MKDAEGNKKIKGIYENAYKRGLNAASASSYISAKHGSFPPSLDASIKVKLSKWISPMQKIMFGQKLLR